MTTGSFSAAHLSGLTTALSGRYQLERVLGAGGMATVYLAEDARHGRRVAIKVLHPELSAVLGPERFLKEIELTAKLQHPHILPLFDSGSAEGLLYYVMPFVEGETLRARLERERQLPIGDAIRIATEVADALGYAHRHGVIHRDVKPENILLHDGHVVVADFGIALAVQHAGGQRMTQTGLSLGTPQYMAPEQAMGERDIGPRADVYALGAVTYEMLVGEPPFTGPSAQAIVAKVMTDRPAPPSSVRDTIESYLDDAVLTALAKLPADRFATAAELAQALRASGEAPNAMSGRSRASALADRRRRRAWSWVALALVVGALGGGLAGQSWVRGRQARPQVMRFAVALERTERTAVSGGTDAPVFSPDGRAFLYREDQGALMLRELDQPEAMRLPGTDEAWGQFFSPDGETIGFVEGFPGSLKLIRLDGSAPVTLVPDSAQGFSASWGEDGWIYYVGGSPAALRRVRASGGPSELMLAPDTSRGELAFTWPELLPGGRVLLLTVVRRDRGADVAALDLESRELRVLARGFRGMYARSGHLVTVHGDGRIFAAPFDAQRAVVSGRAVQVGDGVRVVDGAPFIGLSRTGTLLYLTARQSRQVVLVARDGSEQPLDPAWTGEIETTALSPDGTRLAVSEKREGVSEIWLKDLRSGSYSRLASGGVFNYRPAWSSDGATVLFTSDRDGLLKLYSVPADGATPPRLFASTNRPVDESHVSPDGRWLLFRLGSGSRRDIHGVRIGVDSFPGRPLVATDAEEYAPALSPDGRWLAYAAYDASGRSEVYVRPFPATSAARWTVSSGGGTEPVWAKSGRELYYRDAGQRLVAVALTPGPSFGIESRRVLFSTSEYTSDTRHAAYLVMPDGQFLFTRILGGATPRYVLVGNWFTELEQQVPR
ncbi:MAG TPA: protein kinase [Gemmatimonadaceae bacterium]|nr:protein kinase [Gemmatimonadaceae bacterium]